MSISLFGPPQIRRGNEQISIQRRKDLALLIYLLVTSQSHSRDTLATLLWQDQSQAETRSNLRKSLSRLKTLLGDDVFLTSSDRVSLNPKLTVNLDIARFEAQAQQVREHGHADNGSGPYLCEKCQQDLEEAVALYRADFLQGFGLPDSSAFEEWQFFQSESLRKNLSEILEQLARSYADRTEYNAAIESARRWVALDRLNESAQRQLITLYALSGQRAAAKRQFEECKRILKEELDTEPEEETLQLFEDLQKKRPDHPARKAVVDAVPLNTRSKKHQFPVHPAPFIGREKELREITRILQESPYRLVTLLGPGGSGKTRLALHVGALLDQADRELFQDGVWFVPLAPLTSPNSILSAITQSLGVAGNLSGSDALLGELHGREMLLLLDNFEHLLNADSSKLITDILSASPRIKVMITSRERLNVEGEVVFPVGGLEMPTEGASLSFREGNFRFTEFSALRLFEQCAMRVQPGFQISEENYRSIIDICDAVQGMPLAIELAASWVEIYSPREMLAEIVRSLDFLHSEWRDLPDRQRSLRAVFDSSWSLLDKMTRPVIKALSVFRSSFTREAAQAISGASAKTLLDLTHKSWIQRLSDGRYQIHELLRQFAFEKLESEKATFDLVMKRYSNYYAAYAARLWEDLKGANQQRALSGMEAEFDNIHVAWSWLVSTRDIENAIQNMLPILFHYAELRIKGDTLLQMLDMALASLPAYEAGQSAQIRQQEIILRSAKGAFLQGGDSLRAIIPDVIFPIDTTSIRRAWTLAQKHNAFPELGFWSILLCYVYGRIIQYDEGVRQLERLLRSFERTSQPWELATGYLHLLKLLIPNERSGSRRRKQLTAYLSHARNIFVYLGDTLNAGHIMSLWGDLKYQEQDLERAIHQWQLARMSFLNAGEWAAASYVLWQLSDACLQIGEFQKAFAGYGEIADTFREHGLRLVQISALSKESYEKVRHGDIEEALQIRRTCLEMILETGVTYQFAWNYWEMGDLFRVKGDSEAASEWYERAYQIFDREQDHVGRSYYFRGMGDIALGRKDYESARDHFLTSVDLAKSVNHTWMVCYTLSKLAHAQVELHEIKSARKNFRQALQYGMKTLDKGIMLVALAEYAEFCSKQGRNERAVELCSLVNSHFASWHETKKQVSTLLDSLKKSLPRERFSQAIKYGHSLDLWKTVESLSNRTRTSTSKAL